MILYLALVLSFNISAQSFDYKHIDCKIRFKSTDHFLNKLANKELLEKGYSPYPFVENNRMNTGDLYFNLDFRRDPEKLWKDCLVKASIKKASGQKPLSKDKTLFGREIRRALPRHTFDGDERCRRALKDSFIHIPYCKKMTIDEKVRGN